ncbi:hypothetical protein L3Y34_009413 [Caenorhabditis briggsae]|uniref:Uncharacterized protein n=1 Tax=Caenorhabditis briggsae TaxID=6238 RepID=A0AAE9A5B8_CAEBR|nr:hypothetical protein L3Y34_009413 [Caenorhabditis briggsae]
MTTDSSGNSIGYPASILKDVPAPYNPPSATEVVENSSPTSPQKQTVTTQPSEAVFPDKAPCVDCCGDRCADNCRYCCAGCVAGIPEMIIGCLRS